MCVVDWRSQKDKFPCTCLTEQKYQWPWCQCHQKREQLLQWLWGKEKYDHTQVTLCVLFIQWFNSDPRQRNHLDLCPVLLLANIYAKTCMHELFPGLYSTLWNPTQTGAGASKLPWEWSYPDEYFWCRSLPADICGLCSLSRQTLLNSDLQNRAEGDTTAQGQLCFLSGGRAFFVLVSNVAISRWNMPARRTWWETSSHSSFLLHTSISVEII